MLIWVVEFLREHAQAYTHRLAILLFQNFVRGVFTRKCCDASALAIVNASPRKKVIAGIYHE